MCMYHISFKVSFPVRDLFDLADLRIKRDRLLIIKVVCCTLKVRIYRKSCGRTVGRSERLTNRPTSH